MNSKTEVIWGVCIAVLASGVIVVGCAGPKATPQTIVSGAEPTAPPPVAPAPTGPSTALSGSQLWAENCAMCHNGRLPTDYSDGQWDVAVMHMRIQARLTGEEERQITKFLKASN